MAGNPRGRLWMTHEPYGRHVAGVDIGETVTNVDDNGHQAIIKSLLRWDQMVTDSSPSIRSLRLVDSLIVADRRVRTTPELPTRRLQTCA